MRKRLFVLLACLFAVMIGYGITMPVLPSYTERLALEGGASRLSLPIHIALLTSIYAFAQFILLRSGGDGRTRLGDAGSCSSG